MQSAAHAAGTSEMTGVTGSQRARWEAVEAMGSGSGSPRKGSGIFIAEETRPLSSSEPSSYSPTLFLHLMVRFSC